LATKTIRTLNYIKNLNKTGELKIFQRQN